LIGDGKVVIGVKRASVRLFQPFWPVSLSPGASALFLPANVSRIPCMRSLWLAAAAPPDWMQIEPPLGLISMTRFAMLTPMS
jgi:hypothetical protein